MRIFYILVVFISGFWSVARADAYFPRNEVTLGYANRDLWNPQIPHRFSPLVFGAHTKADQGYLLTLEETFFHTPEHFSIFSAVSTAQWMRDRESLWTASAYLGFKWWIIRTSRFNPYLIYSIAGPTYISKNSLGPAQLSGAHFLFQDFIGAGVLLGAQHALDVRLSLVHYSNGDWFVNNNGFDGPIMLSLGYAF